MVLLFNASVDVFPSLEDEGDVGGFFFEGLVSPNVANKEAIIFDVLRKD